jgi:FKBP-type peptidyl-prolyl cis-trans isomerase
MMKKTGGLLLITMLVCGVSCDDDDELLVFRSYADQLAYDVEILDNYLSENGITAQIHNTGLRYIIVEQGTGVAPTLDNSVKAKYKGTFLDGETFDESVNGITFSLQSVIAAWRIGMPLINEGGKIILYVPSGLGYGRRGSGKSIPGNANLIFEVELLEVL